MVFRTPVWMHATLPAKNARVPVHAHLSNGAEASLPWKQLRTYLESCASIVQAVVAARPPAVSTNSVARRCPLKKSVQIHASSWRGCRCGVAPASFDHLRLCRSHPACLWFALALGRRSHPPQDFFSPFFSRASLRVCVSLCRSVCLSVYLRVCESVCLSVCLSTCVWVCVRMRESERPCPQRDGEANEQRDGNDRSTSRTIDLILWRICTWALPKCRVCSTHRNKDLIKKADFEQKDP